MGQEEDVDSDDPFMAEQVLTGIELGREAVCTGMDLSAPDGGAAAKLSVNKVLLHGSDSGKENFVKTLFHLFLDQFD